MSSAESDSAAIAVLRARLDRAEAREQISEIIFRYARACDRNDEALLRSCFWPESQHKHGRFEGLSSDFVAFAMGIVKGFKWNAHNITNVSIEVNGDRAFSECHYFAHHRVATEAGEEDQFQQGRYIDRHERRGGVWKIIQRRGVSDYAAAAPARTLYAEWPLANRSRQSADDDYYKMHQAFLDGR